MKSSVSRTEFASLVDIVRLGALNTPDKTALVFLDNGDEELVRLTYGELDEKARRIAVQLATVTNQGDRALLLYSSSLEFPGAFLGCLYAGVVAVPAYPPRPKRPMNRLQAIAADAGARVILTSARTLGELKDRCSGVPELEGIQFIATDVHGVVDGDSWNPRSFEPGMLAFLQYTSGSTGLPKGVMVSHGNIIANLNVARSVRQSSTARGDLILASWLPMFHDMGLVGALLWPLFDGGTLIHMEPAAFIQKPVRWLQAISKYRAEISPAPNSAFELCARKVTAQQKEGLDLSSWRLAFNGAEPVRHETIKRFTEAFESRGFRPGTMYPCYGMAETTLIVTGGTGGELPVFEPFDSSALKERFAIPPRGADTEVIKVGCGRTWNEHKVRIVDPETQEASAENQIGEIWVSGPSVAMGYWNRPELSEATFEARIRYEGTEQFLRTGDLGFLKGDDLFVAGRLKDLIIISGRNHYPQDIEQTLEERNTAFAPNACAAFSVEVNDEERLVAVCEIRREHLRRLDSDELVACVRRAVAENHELDLYAVLFLKPFGMPRTSSGKIQRHVCRMLFAVGEWPDCIAQWRNEKPTDSETEPAASVLQPTRISIERWLTDRVAAKLGISPGAIGLREPFSQYGLESRDAIAISGELQEWLGISLPPTLIYDYPNVETLAGYLANETGAGDRYFETGISNSPIAIIGLGCRFPGANSPDNYWKLLNDGVDAIRPAPYRAGLDQTSTEAPAGVSVGGYLDDVDLFEAEFFGVSRREAELMDPQHRLLIEVTWEALEHAGVSPESLAGTDTAVAVGISNADYSRLRPDGPSAIDPYIATGNALSIAANRISYLLDLRGPSWAVDTACSSSLVAVHQACQSLHMGECQLAIAGGVNLILTPKLNRAFSSAGMLSPDGRCKTFDDGANGYVRGEGAGVIVLKRLDDAERDGDNILAVIRGSAVNQDGRSNGLTAPNGPAQQAAIRQALRVAGVKAHEINYVEAHGTGTPLGDPIELNSLVAVLSEGRNNDDTCWVGSAKTNIGHLESAAGIAGIIKVVLALVNQTVPPHLQLRQLNSSIKLDGTAIRIPTSPQPWRRGKRRLAGVSSFGFGGTNAHIIVEEGPASAESHGDETKPCQILALSARTASALQTMTKAYAGYLRTRGDASLAEFAYTVNVGRSHLPFRFAVVAATVDEALAQLEAHPGNAASAKATRIAFLFTGQGAQYRGMGRQLFDSHAGFRRTLEQCNELLRGELPKPLLDVIFGQGNDINETIYAQPALFALEYALASIWKEWGIVPSAMLGHSVGEFGAACFAGMFSLEDGLRMIARRGQLMQSLPRTGSMLAVFAGELACIEAIGTVTSGSELVSVAAVNGPLHTVLSGDTETIRQIEFELTARGLGVQTLNVSHAFHSPLMKPIVEQLGRVVAEVDFHTPKIDLISSVSGVKAGNEITAAGYWRDQALAPVHFGRGMESLKAMGIDAFVEIGPRPVLSAMAKQYLGYPDGAWMPSIDSGGQNYRSMFETLGKLYTSGSSVNWRAVHDGPSRRRISLPTYPFERQSYWLDEDASPVAINLKRTVGGSGHPFLGTRVGEAANSPGTHVWETWLDGSSKTLLDGHRLMGSTVAPYSAFVEMALAAAPQVYPGQFHQIEDLSLHQPLFISRNKPSVIQIVLDELSEGNLSFKVFSRHAQQVSSNHEWTLCASATIVGNGLESA